MKAKRSAIAGAALATGALLTACKPVSAEIDTGRVVRIAELEIEPAQLEAYRTALREEIAASIQRKAGVLTLYAVAVKNYLNPIRLFERYENASAYQAPPIATFQEVQERDYRHGAVPRAY